MAEINDLSVTPGGNETRVGAVWAEGMSAPSINNAAREDEAILARWFSDTNGSLTSGGTSSAYTLSPNRTISTLYNGLMFVFEAHVSCSAGATLNVAGTGAKPLKWANNAAINFNDIVAGGKLAIIYKPSSDCWQVITSPSAVTPMGPDTGLGGTTGLVGAPAAGDGARRAYWCADGTWRVPIPPGIGPLPFSGPESAVPEGYVLCAGQAINRTVYAGLFGVIGITFGAGNGTTTFNVPDARGLVVIGKENMGGSTRGMITSASVNGANSTILGGIGGSQSVTLNDAQLASHGHSGAITSVGDHTHVSELIWAAGAGGGASRRMEPPWDGGAAGERTSQSRLAINANGAHTHNITISATGGNAPHSNTQPWLAVNCIISY